ncbi:MAG: quinone-dependent dihydroorotate dehydrogenase [Elusimicrobia bacterium]|nr:quinone-dependent dihydroorotate dehydrogenase [Elusimicrobiota bacterium]
MTFYRAAVRPLLFKLEPETAHQLAVKALELAGAAPLGRTLLERAFAFGDPALETEVAGLRFPNPIGLAAGFDKDARLTRALPCLGFGFVEVGTVTPKPQPGNPRPRMFRIPEAEALLNRLGFNSEGAAAAAERLARAGRCRVPLGANLGMNAATAPEKAHLDYGEAFSALRERADYFVVNVSSPNTTGLRRLQDRLSLERILTEIRGRNKERKPVFVKVAPDLSTDHLVDLIPLVTHEASGLVIGNTTISRDGVPQRWATEPGGLSGAPLRERSTRLIAHVYRMSGGRLPIIGVGGVFSAEDAWLKLCAGASLVQVYTGLVYRGPGLVRELNQGLLALARRVGLKKVSDAVGRSQPGTSAQKT